MKKGRRGKTLKEETQKRPLPETLKERNIKKKGAANPIPAAPPSTLCFSPVSLDFAFNSKFPSFLAKIINRLLLHACVNLSRIAGLDPAQKKKEWAGSGL